MEQSLHYLGFGFMEIQVEISSICPLDCIHCSSLEIRKNTKTVDNFFDRILNVVGTFGGEKRIWLTGGEPLALPNLIEFVQSLKNISNTNIGLFTCGCTKKQGDIYPVTLDFANQLHLNGVNDCYFSFYHWKESIHNYITTKNSFEITLESVFNMKKAGINVKAHLPLTKFVSKHIDKTIVYLSKLGISEVRLMKLVCTGSAVENWDKIGVEYAKQDQLIQSVMFRTWPLEITISGYPRLCACRKFDGAKGCQAGIHLLYITNNGDVYPCACVSSDTRFKLGNIAEPLILFKKISEIPYGDGYYRDCLANLYNP